MKRSIAALLALGLSACAVNLGGPADIPVPTVAVAADAGTSAAAIAAVITDADARAALVIAPADADWYAELATATGLELSRPGELDGSSAAFLVEREALGDTTVTLEYDGDRLRVHDALYAIEAGVDMIDTSIVPFANGTGQPDTLRMYHMLTDHSRQPKFEDGHFEALQNMREHFKKVYAELSDFTGPKNADCMPIRNSTSTSSSTGSV